MGVINTMLKSRKLFAIITSLLVFAQMGFSLDNNSLEETDPFKEASVSIKFYNRTIYYPGNSNDTPIYIHVTIKNNGLDTLRFKLADDRAFSLDFNAMTVKNSTLKQTDNIIEKRTTNQTVYFREISLECGEEYSFIENLKEYIQIPDPSVYYLEMTFYPELYKTRSIKLKSNRLTLNISPSPSAASSSFIPVNNESAGILKQEPISPDKVVEQTILARQRSLWDQYFLYLDVESLLKRNKNLKNKYITVSADERERMIQSFKADLMLSKIENDIIAIPERFTIDKTTYTPVEGTVVVIEYFKYATYTEKKSYTYKLRQREGIWMIYDYTVTNLGTE